LRGINVNGVLGESIIVPGFAVISGIMFCSIFILFKNNLVKFITFYTTYVSMSDNNNVEFKGYFDKDGILVIESVIDKEEPKSNEPK
jgi:hypothetical protein